MATTAAAAAAHDTSGIDLHIAMEAAANTSLISTGPKTAKYMAILEKKLNTDIGFYYWKKYTAAAFWSQISMPVNLSITLLSGLTTAQANSSSVLPSELYARVTIAMLLLTTINTFFRPHAQMTANLEALQKWNAIGMEFEMVYYSDLDNDYSDGKPLETAIEQYQAVQKRIHEQRASEGLAITNFFTDLLFILAYYSCCRRHRKWIEKERRGE